MDNLINFGKQAFEAYEKSQGGDNQSNNGGGQTQFPSSSSNQNPYESADSQNQYQGQGAHQGQGGGEFGVQGGAHLNSYNNNAQSQGYPVDNSAAVQHAASQSGEDSSLFEQAMQHASQYANTSNHQIDEDELTNAHKAAYSGDASSLGANGMGMAAAMQALKSFTSGSSSNASAGSGGSFQTQLIGQAMSEAAKLFDQSGGGSGGSKQDAINSAGAMAMKLLMKSQVSGLMGGSSGGGGVSSLLGMASKFM